MRDNIEINYQYFVTSTEEHFASHPNCAALILDFAEKYVFNDAFEIELKNINLFDLYCFSRSEGDSVELFIENLIFHHERFIKPATHRPLFLSYLERYKLSLSVREF